MKTIRRIRNRDRGASLIEFAILMPLLILLLFGIVEFAWAFSQNVDVRHGAREGARLAAVDYGAGNAGLITGSGGVCSRMDLSSGQTVTIASTDLLAPVGVGVGDEVTVTVSAPLDTLTGFFNAILPATLSSTVAIRIEQPPSWTNTSVACT
jgi:Flp pilus assembly protein TadG